MLTIASSSEKILENYSDKNLEASYRFIKDNIYLKAVVNPKTGKQMLEMIKQNPIRARTTMFMCAQLVGSLAILLAPFIPTTADSIWWQLGLQGSVNSARWEDAGEIRLQEGHAIGAPTPLFKKITNEQIKDYTRNTN